MEEKDNVQTNGNIICGRNSVLEALRSGREIDRLLVAHGQTGGSVQAIIAKCAAKGILIKEVSQQKLDFLCGGSSHQGVVLMIASQEYSTVEDILAYAAEKNEPPFIIICDELEDPHNLGAIIRSAEAAGVHGIIIPKRRSASLNATVAKSASGALEYMRVARVTNIPNTIDELKKQGVWCFAAEAGGNSVYDTDFKGPCAIVLGSEGNGVSQTVRDAATHHLALPMRGGAESLNAAVAAGIMIYEMARKL